MPQTSDIILRLTEVSKVFTQKNSEKKTSLKAVDKVNLEIPRGGIFGIVGESGCGKSTIAKMVTQLLNCSSGDILFEGNSIRTNKREKKINYYKKVQMVFQDPFSSINPRQTIYTAVTAPLRSLYRITPKEIELRFQEIMNWVGIPERLHYAYPHELSGGQLQRVAIARSLIVRPDLLVADEPIAALDVSIQSQILNLLIDLKKKLGMTVLFISHDLRVVQNFTDMVAIMYLGNIVEVGTTEEVFEHPKHPYTQALMKSIPDMNSKGRGSMEVLEGEVPSLYKIPSGCPFHTRCPFQQERCRNEKPFLETIEQGSESGLKKVACFYPLKEKIEEETNSGKVEQGSIRVSMDVK